MLTHLRWRAPTRMVAGLFVLLVMLVALVHPQGIAGFLQRAGTIGSGAASSVVLFGAYFFASSMIVTSYYGLILELRHRMQLRLRTGAVGLDRLTGFRNAPFSRAVYVRAGDMHPCSARRVRLSIVISLAVSIAFSRFIRTEYEQVPRVQHRRAWSVLRPGRRRTVVCTAGLIARTTWWLVWLNSPRDKSIKFGDVISLPDGFTGEITRQSLRYTQLTDRNQVNVLVPNSIMTTRELTNFTRDSGDIRLEVNVSVRSEDWKRCSEIAEKACLRARRVLRGVSEKPRVFLTSFGGSVCELNVRFWIEDPQNGIANVKSDVMRAIASAFRQAKPPVEIAAPLHDVRMASEDTPRSQLLPEDQADS